MSNEAVISIESPDRIFPVELLDERGRRLARDYGKLVLKVRAGSYVARCEVGGPALDRAVRLAAGEAKTISFKRVDLPRLPSAAPVVIAVTRHEFYTEDAAALANEVLGEWDREGANLVLFASRFEYAKRPTGTDVEPVHWGDVRLRDARGNVLAELPGDAARRDSDRAVGRAGVAVKHLPSGGYFLEWPTADPNDESVLLQPLWLSAGWTTLLFASSLGDSPTPRRETVSIQMTRNESKIEPEDPEQNYLNTAAELALASFRTGRRQLGDEALHHLLNAKFVNPMLGILGAYVLLYDRHADLALLSRVIHNLGLLVGDHPDVAALQLLSSGYPSEQPAPRGLMLNFPPMVHVGLLGADASEWREERRLLPSPTAPDRMSPVTRLARQRALPEGPWTAFWHPAKDPMVQPALAPTGTDLRLQEAVPRAWPTGQARLDPHDVRALIQRSFPNLAGRGILTAQGPSPKALLYLLQDAQAPVEEAAVASTLDATRALLGYLLSIAKSQGFESLAKLAPDQLDWAGLSPRQVRHVMELAMHRQPARLRDA